MADHIWQPKGFDLNKSYALQSLAAGVATKEQQIEALKYIVEDLCGTYSITFDPDNARLDAHNQGRAYVGHAIAQIVKMQLHKVSKILTKEKTNDRPNRSSRKSAD